LSSLHARQLQEKENGMKKLLAVLAAAGLMAAATAAFGAGITTSKHNLSATGPSGYSGTTTQICIFCHAPHNAKESLPLWNRSNPTGAFKLYSGVGMANVSFKTGFTTDSTSLFCMSCHDGVTKMNAVYNAGAIDGNALNHYVERVAGTFGNVAITGSGNLTTDLSKTHPINFPVGTTDPQSDLHSGGGTTMGSAGFTMPLFKATRSGASTNRSLECGSCHAVHDSAISPFLRYTMAGSALCLGCHNK